MAPRAIKNGKPSAAPKIVPNGEFDPQLLAANVCNALISRDALSRLFSGFDGKDRDLNREAGYPEEITPEHYKRMYDREGVAARVVNVFPDECWAMDPLVYEQEDDEQTDFEKALIDLNKTCNIFHYLHRIDRLSGVGHYGVLLMGIGDKLALDKPVAGMPDFSDDIEEQKAEPPKRRLLYMRPFDEVQAKISKYENRKNSPRFGLPIEYDISFSDPSNDQPGGYNLPMRNMKVHWHRILHVADNRESSEVFGAPRQRCVYNRLHDLRKILGGSGEMFWKGGFPGYSFEMDPQLAALGSTIDEEKLKAQIKAYYDGIQRYLALKGMTTKSLAPQVASPEDHVRGEIMAICISIGVPMRVFIGSEEAKLSSTQDAITWNKKLVRRNDKYTTPLLLMPFIMRLIMLGVLPKPSQVLVDWPDLNTSTDTEKADVAEKLTKAISLYMESGSASIMTPVDFFVYILGLSMPQAELLYSKALGDAADLERLLEVAIPSTPAAEG